MTTFFAMDCACKGSNLDKMIQPAILMILFDKDLHGFAIINELGRTIMFGGTAPDKAGVYRYLKKMEAAELLKSEWVLDEAGDKPKKIYSITDNGRHCLINWQTALDDYSDRLKKFCAEIGEVLAE
ncbi:MAG: PadR family transcriptional regulator [Lentihominibacter sp.]|jgi:PadR family transcriptional regulator PadR